MRSPGWGCARRSVRPDYHANEALGPIVSGARFQLTAHAHPTGPLTQALGERLAENCKRAFSRREPRYADIIAEAAKARSRTNWTKRWLYHSAEHTARESHCLTVQKGVASCSVRPAAAIDRVR